MVSEEQNSEIELASEIIPVPQVPPQVEVEAPTPKATDETNEKPDDIPQGKSRQRKRALYAAILKQMEFYFSDSNLSKDRFLAEKIKECSDVPLDIFLKFNRIRSLTTDIDRLAKAISKSTILQVSEDGKTVKRTTPIIEKTNVDECTVYVQRLPSDADHDWLSSLFSEYGPVSYVSIPKFKSNQKIKGFAFIEFETPESAKKCLKVFRAKGCELPSQTSPAEVLSITTFTEEEKEQNGTKSSENTGNSRKQKHEKSVDTEEPKTKKQRQSLKFDEKNESDNNEKESNLNSSDSSTQKEEKRGKKRKNRLSLEEAQSSETESQNISKENNKKQKTEELEVEAGSESSTTNETNKDGKKRKKSKIEIESESENSVKNETDKESKKRKKLKVDMSKVEIHSESVEVNEDVKEENEEAVESTNDKGVPEKKKKKKRKKKSHASYEVLQTVDMGLQVMGKKDWKKLRNKYLELQKAKMRQLKQNIRRARWNQWGDRNRMETEQEETTGNKKENPASVLEFIPNVIIKIELNEPCIDPKGFKAELKSASNNIKYIDVKEGSHEAYIRCDSSEAAAALAQKSIEEKHLVVLTGDEEKHYWDKIIQDRQEKIGNKIRINQRGRNKLLKKAEKELGKHIKFDEV